MVVLYDNRIWFKNKNLNTILVAIHIGRKIVFDRYAKRPMIQQESKVIMYEVETKLLIRINEFCVTNIFNLRYFVSYILLLRGTEKKCKPSLCS